MARVAGPTHREVERRVGAYRRLLVGEIRGTLRTVAAQLRAPVTVDDLAPVTAEWTRRVDAQLLAPLADAGTEGAEITRRHQQAAVDAARAGVTAAAEGFEIPPVQLPQAETRLANARNRLVATGNEIWEVARGALVEGLQAGEGVRYLQDRVTGAVGFGEVRAELVARSEVSQAMNQGSLDQMRSLGATGTQKEWVAIQDARTRPEHAEMDGVRVGLDDVFPIGFDPGDDYNCRCTLVYDLPDDEAARIGDELPSEPEFAEPTYLSNSYSGLPDAGANARFREGGQGFSSATLQKLGFTPRGTGLTAAEVKALRERILKFNELLGERFGAVMQRAENVERAEELGVGVSGGYKASQVYAYIRNGNILGLNPRLLRDYRVVSDEASGWHPPGTGTIEDFLVHEHGHLFLQGNYGYGHGSLGAWERRILAKERAWEAAGQVPGAPKNFSQAYKKVSRYAQTAPTEGEAEMWAYYHMGGKARPAWIVKWGETLMRELGLDPTPLCVDLRLC